MAEDAAPEARSATVALRASSPSTAARSRPSKTIGAPSAQRELLPLSATVSTNSIRQSAIRLSMTSMQGAIPTIASSTSVRVMPGPFRSRSKTNANSGSTRGWSSVQRDLAVRCDHHVVEDMAVVGRPDVEKLLDRLAGGADLAADERGTSGEPQPYVLFLHRVRVRRAEVRVASADWAQRPAVTLGFEEFVSDRCDVVGETHSIAIRYTIP